MNIKHKLRKQWVLRALIGLALMGIIVPAVVITFGVIRDRQEVVALEVLQTQADSKFQVNSQEITELAAESLVSTSTSTSTTTSTVTTSVATPNAVVPPKTTTTTSTTTTLPPPPSEDPEVDRMICVTYIPRLDISKLSLLMGDSEKKSTPEGGELRLYNGWKLPGQGSVVGIGGHRTSATEPFRFIDTLATGDEVVLVCEWGVTYVYEVVASAIVPDVNNEFYEFAVRTEQTQTTESLLVYSCGDSAGTPGGTATRVMVTALLRSSFLTPTE